MTDQPLSVGRHANNCGKCDKPPAFDIGPQDTYITIKCNYCDLSLTYSGELDCVGQWNSVADAFKKANIQADKCSSTCTYYSEQAAYLRKWEEDCSYLKQFIILKNLGDEFLKWMAGS